MTDVLTQLLRVRDTDCNTINYCRGDSGGTELCIQTSAQANSVGSSRAATSGSRHVRRPSTAAAFATAPAGRATQAESDQTGKTTGLAEFDDMREATAMRNSSGLAEATPSSEGSEMRMPGQQVSASLPREPTMQALFTVDSTITLIYGPPKRGKSY